MCDECLKTINSGDNDFIEWSRVFVYTPIKPLLEARRQDLLSKSKHGDDYQDTSKGRNRYERRTKSHIATTVAQYNKIDMNTFFKEDILNVMINVMGETDNYLVKIKFGGVLAEIAKEVKSHNNTLDFGVILRSLLVVFNSDDVYVSCSCPDFRYRFAYVATKNNYNSGEPETRVADITNPRDSKGAACKHVLNVLANLDWVMKVASVINNYIKYAKEYMQKNFADFIFPKIFGMPYNKAIQLGIFDTDEFDTSQQAIDIANKIGRTSGQYQTGKETPGQMKFTKKPAVDNPNQLKLDLH